MLQCHKYCCTDVIYDQRAKIISLHRQPCCTAKTTEAEHSFQVFDISLISSYRGLACLAFSRLWVSCQISPKKSMGSPEPRHTLWACGLTTHHIPFWFRSATQFPKPVLKNPAWVAHLRTQRLRCFGNEGSL